jgi:hypothetical protein
MRMAQGEEWSQLVGGRHIDPLELVNFLQTDGVKDDALSDSFVEIRREFLRSAKIT